MQETSWRDEENIKRLQQEFFTGKDGIEVERKMDARLSELRRQGHTLVRRVKIGRNDKCPCGVKKNLKGAALIR